MLYVICQYLQVRRQKLNGTPPGHFQIGQEPISHIPSNHPDKILAVAKLRTKVWLEEKLSPVNISGCK